jgi:hypothetical protein
MDKGVERPRRLGGSETGVGQLEARHFATAQRVARPGDGHFIKVVHVLFP